MKSRQKQILIAGPCAIESEKQLKISIKEVKKRKIDFLRTPLWKPRTKPGFDGMAKRGLGYLRKVKNEGLSPAIEAITPEHAKMVIDTIPDSEILIWIGARNQNHFVQKEIARITARNKKAKLLVKNQPWPSKDHFLGVIAHIRETGFENKRLLLCHRGFFPGGENLENYRNIPDYKMAMKIKNETGLPMIIDPSHIGGSVVNVKEVVKRASNYNFDGTMVEVHPNPAGALTDKGQQLSWEQFDSVFYSSSTSSLA